MPRGLTVGLLLAAGESRRMGQLKALLPWNGTPLIEHQIAALQGAGVDLVVVVLGHEAQRVKALVGVKEGVTCVVNPDYMEGKTTSIKAGLNALGHEEPAALLILNVDQPRTAGAIRRLLQQHRQGRSLITIPTYRGKGGHPLVLDPSLLDELRSISEETLGLMAVVRR
ncbi:MAG: nucleotidyltransferase family protein, partial [Chloroflexota bacterium]